MTATGVNASATSGDRLLQTFTNTRWWIQNGSKGACVTERGVATKKKQMSASPTVNIISFAEREQIRKGEKCNKKRRYYPVLFSSYTLVVIVQQKYLRRRSYLTSDNTSIFAEISASFFVNYFYFIFLIASSSIVKVSFSLLFYRCLKACFSNWFSPPIGSTSRLALTGSDPYLPSHVSLCHSLSLSRLLSFSHTDALVSVSLSLSKLLKKAATNTKRL